MKNQGFLFVLGLIIGLFAGGILMWNVNEIVENKLSTFSSLVDKITINQSKILSKKESEEESDKENPSKNTKKSYKPKIEENNDEKDTNNRLENDSMPLAKDSLATTQNIVSNDTLNISENQYDIVVKKDELLFSRTVDIEIIRDSLKTQKNDSLLAELSGIGKQKENSKYSVEFWRSPINYKGYKMGNRKILLYGLAHEADISVISLDDKVILNYNSEFYLLENTFDFKPYQKIKNEALLAKLKK